jgi:hypothetical protein
VDVKTRNEVAVINPRREKVARRCGRLGGDRRLFRGPVRSPAEQRHCAFAPHRPLFVGWALLSHPLSAPALLAIPAPTATIAAAALLAGMSLNFANTL